MTKELDATPPAAAIADAPIPLTPAFKHTPGPLSAAWQEQWPFGIVAVDATGNEVWNERPHCFSSTSKTLQDHLDCVGFEPEDRDRCRAILQRQFADAVLRAAAPELLDVLREYAMLGGGKCTISKAHAEKARAAIAKALGQGGPKGSAEGASVPTPVGGGEA